ncbi:kinase-like domain-containing protein [Pseudomassariella vexata]|uniref:Kinase-like domain-containing protein n=1 Tax=Pseudomassariella vexata TaxID=1141098 RepID=A0A1Y2EHX7_9PEZI|nr:kinase-like domain-containing protein [Pseudomassariella vexata]ORY71037.1 kinase-like domain-containing protein [Pseudomassariella vexata]
MNSRPPVRPIQLQFRTHTIAPSPPLPEPIFEEPTPFSADDPPYQPSPLGSSRSGRNPLQITTDIRPEAPARTDSLNSNYGLSASSRPALQHKSSTSSLYPISRTPSFKRAIANNIGSACSSAVASPIITAMGDLTPLPSPLLVGDSPGPWRRLGARPPSREAAPHVMPDSVLVTASGESVASAMAHQSKRKVYAGLNAEDAVENGTGDQGHGRNRSISEYIPDPMAIPKRHVTVSGSHPRSGEGGLNGTDDHHMRREPHLSATRGLGPAAEPPTPPPSESSQSNEKKPKYEFFEAYGRDDKKLRRWRAIKKLGEGTFSRVMLATSQTTIEDDEGERPEHTDDDKSSCEPKLKTLVAVKVCEHGPRGGASETRIEMSLKRELEIMQSIHHPSIVHLKAWNIEQTRALLVLSYCPGGDLFDVATRYRELLTPPLLRRIFAELVGAVRYLHERRIVHRDIKLENVLVNIPVQELAKSNHNWATYPDSIITLTDLGLSRRVADDEKLETRCGSDDYAAPEVILGQPYDGRAIDAWSMGVLLYALLESRLPFDPPPGASDALRMRSRTSHRIARIEWRWIEYAGDDGDHEGDEAKFKAKGLKGAMEVTEGLLKRARSRWPLETVAESEWVRDAIRIQDGPKFKEEEEGEEVL